MEELDDFAFEDPTLGEKVIGNIRNFLKEQKYIIGGLTLALFLFSNFKSYEAAEERRRAGEDQVTIDDRFKDFFGDSFSGKVSNLWFQTGREISHYRHRNDNSDYSLQK